MSDRDERLATAVPQLDGVELLDDVLAGDGRAAEAEHALVGLDCSAAAGSVALDEADERLGGGGERVVNEGQ